MGEQSREAELRQALAMTAAALNAAVAMGQVDPRGRLTPTGRWAHLGSATISEILDRANAALGPDRTTPANIDSVTEKGGRHG